MLRKPDIVPGTGVSGRDEGRSGIWRCFSQELYLPARNKAAGPTSGNARYLSC
jgi:hypothetical protein